LKNKKIANGDGPFWQFFAIGDRPCWHAFAIKAQYLFENGCF